MSVSRKIVCDSCGKEHDYGELRHETVPTGWLTVAGPAMSSVSLSSSGPRHTPVYHLCGWGCVRNFAKDQG